MLTIHRSERADRLVDALAAVLADPPADPFVPEVVAVPSRGVERWISQSLSTALGTRAGRTDGVCANVRFPSPARLVADALACGTGIDPADDPWTERRLPWSLLEVVDECAGQDWCETLGRHLGVGSADAEHRRGRRMTVAQKLAGLFTAYAAQRPDLVRAWVAGDDTGVDDDLLWQAELFRRLRQRIGTSSPAERIEDACTALRTDRAPVDLPDRLSLFGPTRLTVDQLRVVDALAERRDVHLWLPHPSPMLWDRLAGPRGHARRRREDPTADLPEHPLLSSLGRDTRELQLVLADQTAPDRVIHHPADFSADILLRRLQRDIHQDRAPVADFLLEEEDRSVQVHACHGRQRQVEVLREVLLGALEEDPTVELRDIIVMCPDIEAFAPLISASFGLVDEEADEAHPGHRLRVRLADRSLRQTNPVLSVAARLLELADARLTVSEVLDLAAMPPVRRRFGFDDEELERIGDWVRRSGVRWGLDAASRAPYSLQSVQQNTWQSGLDRLLLGVTMDEDDLRTVGLALPLDDVDSGEIDLAGRLSEFVDRLVAAVDRLGSDQPLVEWVVALETSLDELIDVSPREGWQLAQARVQLAEASNAASARSESLSLSLADVRALLAKRLEGRPTRANFRTGHLTMCSMVPMRSVPHRVVCLLGLDDQVFPRHAHLDGDDVLARDPRVGERDSRSEDRQLFLDAILAAEDRLVLLYTGRDERTGAGRPPAVPLGELLDVIDRTATVQAGNVRDRVLIQHPLQSFDPRNFEPGRLVPGLPFSFDGSAHAGSRALRGNRTERPPFLSTPLPQRTADIVSLEELVRFFEHPVRAFLKQRLGIATVAEEEDPADALPVSLDALEQWRVGDRLLAARLSGVPQDQAIRAERLRGGIPPGLLGQAVLDPVAAEVEKLVTGSAPYRVGAPEHLDVAVRLASGTEVVGTVAQVYGDLVVRVFYSRLGAKHRLRAWILLLALVAARPEREWRTVTAGRESASFLGGVGSESARRELDSLVAVYQAGMRAPLPIPPKCAEAYAARRVAGKDPALAAQFAEREWKRPLDGREIGEYDDPDHRTVWGDADLAALLAMPPVSSDLAGSWSEHEPHRFGALACRVWAPLIRAEARL